MREYLSSQSQSLIPLCPWEETFHVVSLFSEGCSSFDFYPVIYCCLFQPLQFLLVLSKQKNVNIARHFSQVNGIQSQPKRRAIFTMLRDGGYDFAFLQESHCTPNAESLWQAEWGGPAYYSNGRSNARGVMIFLPRTSDIKVLQTVKNQEGRLLILQIEKNKVSYSLANIYAPTQEQVQEQINLIDLLERCYRGGQEKRGACLFSSPGLQKSV